MTRLTQKEVPLRWDLECERSFVKLKKKLTIAYVLIILDPNHFYEVLFDASKKGLRGVLMKNGQEVAYVFQ